MRTKHDLIMILTNSVNCPFEYYKNVFIINHNISVIWQARVANEFSVLTFINEVKPNRTFFSELDHVSRVLVLISPVL